MDKIEEEQAKQLLTEQAKQLLARLNMKAQALKELNTKELVTRIEDLEHKLEESMREEASFRHLNTGYLGSDCAEAKRILAELSVRVPETDDEGRQLTAPQKDASDNSCLYHWRSLHSRDTAYMRLFQ